MAGFPTPFIIGIGAMLLMSMVITSDRRDLLRSGPAGA
jgi:hypothetical protein